LRFQTGSKIVFANRRQNLIKSHLSEVVIDPIQLVLIDVLVQLSRKRVRRCAVVAERLLDHHMSRLRQARLGKLLHDRPKQEWRNLQVEDRTLRTVDRITDPLIGAESVKSPLTFDNRAANRSKTSGWSCSPVPWIDSRARCTSCSTPQSSTATPTIGQSSKPRASSRYNDRTLAASFRA
jgi:hypothetical protein